MPQLMKNIQPWTALQPAAPVQAVSTDQSAAVPSQTTPDITPTEDEPARIRRQQYINQIQTLLARPTLNPQDRAELEAAQQQALQGQRAQVEQLGNQINAYAGLPSQMDLTPLLRLSDQWFGGNQAAAYQRPTSPEEKLNTVFGLQNALEKAKTGVSESEAKILQDRAKAEAESRQKQIDTLLNLAKLEQDPSATRSIQGAKLGREDQEKFRKEFGVPIEGLGELVGYTKRMGQLIEDNGGKVPIAGADGAEYASLKSQALTTYNRDKAKLGALAGSDLKLLLGSIAQGENGIDTWLAQQYYGTGGIKKVLNDVEAQADANVADYEEKSNRRFGGSEAVKDTYKVYKKSYDERKNIFTKPKDDELEKELQRRGLKSP